MTLWRPSDVQRAKRVLYANLRILLFALQAGKRNRSENERSCTDGVPRMSSGNIDETNSLIVHHSIQRVGFLRD